MGELALAARPTKYDDVLGNDAVKRVLAHDKGYKSTILFGQAGCGKTTLAKIYGENCKELNAARLKTDDISTLVFAGGVYIIDEFHRLNKAQQSLFLGPMEVGKLLIIATTTETPTDFLIDGLISRFRILRVEKPQPTDIARRLIGICKNAQVKIDSSVAVRLASTCTDVRDAIDTLEDLLVGAGPDGITPELCKIITSKTITMNSTEALKSALQKSIRGSDPDAAAIYANELLEQGELEICARRLRIIACEDVGLACPDAVAFTNACIESALKLGMPEAHYPITECVIYLATRPKSNSVGQAISMADSYPDFIVPKHIRFEHSEGYQYPHDFPNHWIDQKYLPDNRQVYSYGDNKLEQITKAYWDKIKKGK